MIRRTKTGGISTPSAHDFILLFTGEQGQRFGYKDGWTEEGLFLYTGEGQNGDMFFLRGNAAIRDHVKNGKDLHLFEYVGKGGVRYIGQMVCTGYQERMGTDAEDRERRIIVFELTPLKSFDAGMTTDDEKIYKEMWQQPLNSLREKAIASSTAGRSPSERRYFARYRSNAIKIYVLKRANGICEGCSKEAPFKTSSGEPYLAATSHTTFI